MMHYSHYFNNLIQFITIFACNTSRLHNYTFATYSQILSISSRNASNAVKTSFQAMVLPFISENPSANTLLIFVFILFYLCFKHRLLLLTAVKNVSCILFSHRHTITVCMLLSLFAFFFPSLQYYFTLLLSIAILFFTLPYIDMLFPRRNKALYHFLKFLDSLHIIKFMFNIYIDFFDTKKSDFMIRCGVLYSLCFIHLLTSKYIFLHKLDIPHWNLTTLFCSYLLLFFGTIGIYSRFLISCSIIVHDLSWNVLFVVDSDNDSGHHNNSDSERKTSSGKSEGSHRAYSFFDFRKTYNYANTNHLINKYKILGIGVALSTLGLGFYTAHQQGIQNELGRQQNYEFKRQNDLEEVSQGLRTKEKYMEDHRPKPKN